MNEQATIDTADSLGTLSEDVGSVIERWVVGGQDEEIVALTVIAEAMRTMDGPATRERMLRWINERYGDGREHR